MGGAGRETGEGVGHVQRGELLGLPALDEETRLLHPEWDEDSTFEEILERLPGADLHHAARTSVAIE